VAGLQAACLYPLRDGMSLPMLLIASGTARLIYET